MAKESGLGDLFFIDGVDLSGDVGALQRIANPSNLLPLTGIDKSAHERILGLYDGEMAFNSWFNDAASQQHLTLRAKGSGADRIAAWFHGSGIGESAAGLVAKQINYDWNRGADGSLEGSIQCLGNGYGLDWCDQLTAGKRTDTGATNGSSLDNAAATALGLAAYLQVFSFTGTSMTATIQESSDNGGGDAFAAVTGGAFAAVSAVGAQRIVTSLTLAVERYLRVVTTGTFNPCTFAVAATRFPYN